MSEADNHSANQSLLATYAQHIDHIAIAVHDLDEAITSYKRLGFTVADRIDTTGAGSSMSSAVVTAGPLKFVLLQGNDEQSQISQFIRELALFLSLQMAA